VGEDTWQPDEIETPEISIEDPAPVDALLSDPEVAEMQTLEARLSRRPRGFRALQVEASPDNARPEWAVLAYGATTHAAAAAVQQARDAGQRVVLARVRMLWPVPDEELLKAVMGIKHVVVAERNLGQYALEVRRVLPELPVIPAGHPKAPVPHELILQRLQRSPRCC
jgi:TPP-dependent indolepyruvate ferredoxin oxidoreductase alpha subunit